MLNGQLDWILTIIVIYNYNVWICYIHICISKECNISGHKWSTTHRVHKSYRSKIKREWENLHYEYYTVEKKENALIIHSAMETWKVTIIRNFIILCLYPLSKILHSPPSLDSEPGIPLTLNSTCFLLSSGIFF